MNLREPILYVGEEPVGKYVQKLKLLLAELTLKRNAKKEPFLKISKLGCWNSASSRRVSRGYKKVYVNKKEIRAHKFMYEYLVGPVPKGLDLDHLCRNHRAYVQS